MHCTPMETETFAVRSSETLTARAPPPPAPTATAATGSECAAWLISAAAPAGPAATLP